jgi:hypothetical protein
VEPSGSHRGELAIRVGVWSVAGLIPHEHASVCRKAAVLNAGLRSDRAWSSVLALPVSVPPKLRVTAA